MSKYRWTAPKFKVGQRVTFRWNDRNIRVGEIYELDTHYDHTGEAWHSYRVMADGHKVARYTTEKDMWFAP